MRLYEETKNKKKITTDEQTRIFKYRVKMWVRVGGCAMSLLFP